MQVPEKSRVGDRDFISVNRNTKDTMGRKVAEYHITLEKSKQLFIQQGICLAVGEGK